MTTAISPWAATAADQLAAPGEPVFTKDVQRFIYAVNLTDDSLWISVKWPGGATTAFRTAYSPDNLVIREVDHDEAEVNILASSSIGSYHVKIELFDAEHPMLHYTTTFKANRNLYIPFWPRDIVITKNGGNLEDTSGEVYISQVGIRTGLIFAGLKKPESGSFLYLQNFTALADYCQETETSVANTVGGNWPELGFALPITKDKPVPKEKEFTLSDVFVAFNPQVPADQFDIAKQFVDLLAAIYLRLPRPQTVYHDYPEILKKSLNDLSNNKGCWTQYSGHPYLNAYVCDYDTPAEIMVQLAVLLPVYDYKEWSGEDVQIVDDLCAGLPNFYDEKLKTIMRWLPAAENQLDGSEEQKTPKVMDAWYLHHPLLNLSRMALKGDKIAKELFLNSLEYAIKVAHHFKYQWPVFYQMETLEVLKAETQPGEGGEKDVAGIYAHVMLQAWALTGEKRYLNEAERAAKALLTLGFDIFYQANNTAFSAGAMLRLYKETKNELYLNLSYLFIANIFKNVALWNCEYGYGKYFPSFFALFPLNDAPYTAVYEEQEGFSAVHDFLTHAADIELRPSISLLLAEFIRYTISRVVYYYPPMLPAEMLSNEVKTGEIDPKLWIALEDVHDGWEKSGAVGQEVYGAGLAFGIVPRQYIRVPDEEFLIFTDYPTTNVSAKKSKPLTFKVLGSEALTCSVRIINKGKAKLPKFVVSVGNGKRRDIKGKATAEGDLLFEVNGSQKVEIKWT